MRVVFDTDIEAHRHILECAVTGILHECGNSYINSYTEILLYILKNKGVYNGSTIGDISEIKRHESTGLNNDMPMLRPPRHRDDEYIQEEVMNIENQEKELELKYENIRHI